MIERWIYPRGNGKSPIKHKTVVLDEDKIKNEERIEQDIQDLDDYIKSQELEEEKDERTED